MERHSITRVSMAHSRTKDRSLRVGMFYPLLLVREGSLIGHSFLPSPNGDTALENW